jgi:HPt (histidine-containing phosphotransfer) domain-containing protein
MLSEQIPELSSEIQKHVAENNMPALYQAAHKLKSSAKLFHVSTIDTAIDTIEKLSHENNSGEELSNTIKTFCQEVEAIAKELLKRVC